MSRGKKNIDLPSRTFRHRLGRQGSDRRGLPMPSVRSTRILVASSLGSVAVILLTIVYSPQQDDDETPAIKTELRSARPSLDRESSAGRTEDSSSQPGSTERAEPVGRGTGTQMAAEPAGIATQLNLAAQPVKIDFGQTREELLTLGQALTTAYPDEPKAYHVAAQIYSELDRSQAAMSAWKKCVELRPQNPGPYVGLANLYLSRAKEGQAHDLLARATAAGIESAELTLALAETLESLGELSAAREALDRATQRYPDEFKLWSALGRVLNQLREYARAEAALRVAMDLGGESRAVLTNLASALVRQQKRDAASDVRQQLVSLQTPPGGTSPSNPDSAGDDQERTRGFDAAYELGLRDVAFHGYVSASAIAKRYDDSQDAESWALQAQSLKPGDAKSYAMLSAIYRARGDLPAALQVHQALAEQYPRDRRNLMNIANIAGRLGNVKLAEQALEAVVDLNPTDTSALVPLTKLYLMQGKIAAARQYAEQSVQRDPSPSALMVLAQVEQAAGNISRVQELVAQSQELPRQQTQGK